MNNFQVSSSLISGIALFSLSIALWFLTATFPELENGYPGPSLFPRIIALAMGCASIYLMVMGNTLSHRKSTKQRYVSRASLARIAAGLFIVSSYPFLSTRVHFVPIMAGLIFCFGLLLNNRVWHAAIVAILSASIIYSLFTWMLGVPL